MDEHQRHAIVDLAPVMLVKCDSAQRYVFANRAYAERLGFSPTAIVGKSIREVLGEPAYETIRVYLEAVLSGRRVEFDVEVPYARVGPRWIHGVCEPEFDSKGCISGFVGALEDVTTRIHAELALRKSEQRYRLLTEALPFMVWVMRPDLTLEFLNDKSSNYTGLSLAQVNDGGWVSLVYPEDLPKMLATVSGPLERGEPHTAEYRFRRHDGEFRWVQSWAYPLKDDAGVVTQWIGATHDIHERRLYEQRLEESESRFRQLADAIPQIVWMTDAEGKTDYHNERWFEFTGLSPSSAYAEDWRSVVHPEDGERVQSAWNIAAVRGEPFEEEIRIRRVADGDYRWFLTRAIPIRDSQGKPSRWFGTSTDIDDQKRVEQRLLANQRIYQAIGESIDYGIWTADAEGNLTYASPAFLRLTGLTQRECSSFAWMPPNEADHTRSAWKKCVQARERWDVEHCILGTDGERRHVLSRAVPVHAEAGVATSWVGIYLDITRLKQTETALTELNLTLERRVVERSAAAEERTLALAASENELRRQSLVMQSILNSMGEGVIVSDQTGRIVLLNRAAKRLHARASEPSTPEKWSETYSLYRLDGKTAYPADELPLARALRGEGSDEVEMLVVPPPAETTTRISVTGRPLRSDEGTIQGGVVVIRDITSRQQTLELLRESEERFRSAFEFAAIGKGLVVLDGRWLRVNRALCELLGYSEGELLATDFQSITYPEDLAEDLKHVRRLLSGELRTYQMEKRYIHKTGHAIPILLSVSLVRDGAENPKYFIAQIHDLTQLKAAEEERRQSLIRNRFVEQTIAAREDEQRRIARDLHDGVGQSLTSLRLGLRVIEEAADLKQAQLAAGELRRIVISALEEVRALTKSLRPRVLDDLGLIPAMTRLVEDFMKANEIEIRLDTSTMPELRFSDLIETALYRIVQEALTNVAKHSAAGFVVIKLSRCGANLTLTVADDGLGFDTGIQCDTARCFGITGMRERVSLLNGEFQLISDKQEGTTITVSIPLNT